MKKHILGNFVLSNRMNLKKKLLLIESKGNEETKKELLVTDRLKELQSSLNDAIALKNDGKHDIDGIPLSSVIEQRQADVSTFLIENKVYPTQKGFETICNFADHSTNLPKEFPKFGIDFVYSDEQKKTLQGLFSTDKAWLSSEKGNQIENNFLSEFQAKGNIGRRSFSISMHNGKAKINGGYMIESEFDEDLEKKFFERQNQKNHFGLLANVEDKPIEEKTCKELRLECRSLNLSSKGKKAELIERIENS